MSSFSQSLLLSLGVLGILLPSPGYSATDWKKRALDGNPMEAELLKAEFQEDAERFLSTAAEVDNEINRVVEQEISRRKAFIAKGYDRLVSDIDLVQRELRLEAIRYLEAFIRKYPGHPEYTPDALFRLAELYYEKSSIDYAMIMDAYDVAAEQFSKGEISREPEQPFQNFKQTVRVYQVLTEQYPEYRYADAALYLMGYVQDAAGDFKAALATFTALTQGYTESNYLPESYLRIGEYYFDDFDWDNAIAAYKSALQFKESRFYDKAIYKLAWTYFQKFDYDNAIGTFKDLIAYYDDVAAQSKEKGLAQQLRAEAIDYLARSLAEDDWDGDGEPDEAAGVDRAVSYLSDGAAFERDILKGYAKSLYELHEKERYADAARVFSLLIQRDLLDPENPSLQEKVIAILDIMGDRELASLERDRLVESFNPSSDWYAANRLNGAATAEADELVELAMRQQAQLHHQAAQGFRKRASVEQDPSLLQNAFSEYQDAAAGYDRYLASYASSRYGYDMRYYLGETLFFSGQFEKAAREYMRVRDTPGSVKHREDSAYSAIKALESEIELRVKEGKLRPMALPSGGQSVSQEETDTDEAGSKSSEVARVGQKSLEPLVQLWVEQVDSYVDADLTRPDEPEARGVLAYQAADLLHRYKRFDESRPRLEAIIEQYPKTEIAGFSAAHLINSFKEENDWDSIEKWARIISEKEIGLAADQKRLQEEIQVFKLGAQFQFAEQLLEEKKYLEAAEEFERIVDEDKRSTLKFADKALYNAGLAYQEIAYYDSAARVYERIITDPRFKESEFTEDVLFRLAENHKLFFNFSQAVDTYLALVSRNSASKNAPYSLFESARLLENDGRKKEAATQYERYTVLYPTREDAAALLFRAGQIREDMGEVAKANDIFTRFVERFEVVPTAAALVVHARLKLADYLESQGKTRKAMEAYQNVIADFAAKGLETGSPAAAYPAKARFALVEYKYREYKSIVLKGSLAKMGKQIQEKERLLKELEKSYFEVFPYKAFEWTFAAYFRVGSIYAEFANTLYDAPVPSALSDDDRDLYQMELEDVGVRYEDIAVDRFETTVKKAAELKVKNKWTELARRRVNQYKPADYPLLKREKRPTTLTSLFSTGRSVQRGEDGVRRSNPRKETAAPREYTPAPEEPSADDSGGGS